MGAITILSLSASLVGTACILVGLILVVAVLRRHPVSWVTQQGHQTRVTRIGINVYAVAAGMIMLLWLPHVIPTDEDHDVRPEPPQAREARPVQGPAAAGSTQPVWQSAPVSSRQSSVPRATAEPTPREPQAMPVGATQRHSKPENPAAPQPSDLLAGSPKPLFADVRLASVRQVPSTEENLPFQLEIIVQTNLAVSPIAFVFVCDGAIGRAYGRPNDLLGGTYTRMVSDVSRDHPNMFVFGWESPPFTPASNLVVRILSEKPLRLTHWKIKGEPTLRSVKP